MTSPDALRILGPVRPFTSYLLLAVFACIGSGWLAHVHQMEHVGHEGVASAQRSVAASDEDGHDENNCPVCSTLHMPMQFTGYVPLLICLGLIAAFLTQLHPALYPQCTSVWTDSRGPPAV